NNMTDALYDVKTGLITYATRDTVVNNLAIKAHHYIGLDDETIVATNEAKLPVARQLISTLVDDDVELVTIFTGEDVTEEEADELEATLNDELDNMDIEIELIDGGQPVYSYVIMVE